MRQLAMWLLPPSFFIQHLDGPKWRCPPASFWNRPPCSFLERIVFWTTIENIVSRLFFSKNLHLHRKGHSSISIYHGCLAFIRELEVFSNVLFRSRGKSLRVAYLRYRLIHRTLLSLPSSSTTWSRAMKTAPATSLPLKAIRYTSTDEPGQYLFH